MSERLVVLGPQSWLGRELTSLASERGLDTSRWALVDTGSDDRVLTASVSGFNVSSPELDDALADATAVACCGELDEETTTLVTEAAAHLPVLDLMGRLPGEAIEARSGRRLAELEPGLYQSPEAASLMLADLARAARAASAASPVVATVFEPVSLLGEAGISELQAQTVAVLNLDSLPTEVLGRRRAFDVHLGGDDDRARDALLLDQVATLLDEPHAVTLQRLETPLFHGVAVSAHAEVSAEAWRSALAAEPAIEIDEDSSLIGPVDCGEDERAKVTGLRDDGRGGCWCFAAADGLRRGPVGNALALLGAEPTDV